MNLKKILNNEKTIFFISFIWGFAIAVLLLRKCMDGYCIVIKGPDKKDIEGNVYKVDNKCYNFKSKKSKCDKDSIKI